MILDDEMIYRLMNCGDLERVVRGKNRNWIVKKERERESCDSHHSLPTCFLSTMNSYSALSLVVRVFPTALYWSWKVNRAVSQINTMKDTRLRYQI